MPQVNVTLGIITAQKLDALKTQYGSRSQVIAVAVDRLWQQEMDPRYQWKEPVYPEKKADGA